MAGDLPTRSNDSKSISPNRGTPAKPKGSGGFTDLPLAGLFPTAQSASENVLPIEGGSTSGGTGGKGFTTSDYQSDIDAGQRITGMPQMELGTPEWEQMELSKAIENLKAKYTREYMQGGSLSDPYWANQYEQDVKSYADSIRQQSANDRAQKTEAERQTAEAEKNRATERDLARRAERGAMWSSLGGIAGNYAFNERGAVAPSLVLDEATGKMTKVPGKPGYTPFAEGVKKVGGFMKSGMQGPSAPTTQYEPNPSPSGISEWNNDGSPKYGYSSVRSGITPGATSQSFNSYAAPTIAGSMMGALTPGGNVGQKALGGAAMGAVGAGMDLAGVGSFAKNTSNSGPWGRLASSGLAAWANPFSKKSWGKNTLGTVAKLVGGGLINRLGW